MIKDLEESPFENLLPEDNVYTGDFKVATDWISKEIASDLMFSFIEGLD